MPYQIAGDDRAHVTKDEKLVIAEKVLALVKAEIAGDLGVQPCLECTSDVLLSAWALMVGAAPEKSKAFEILGLAKRGVEFQTDVMDPIIASLAATGMKKFLSQGLDIGELLKDAV